MSKAQTYCPVHGAMPANDCAECVGEVVEEVVTPAPAPKPAPRIKTHPQRSTKPPAFKR